MEKEFEAGFAYSDGFRIVGNSHKKGFSFSAEADLTTGIVLSAKATLGIVSGDIYAKTGARMNIKYVRYSSGTPTYCASQAAYLYASVGASAKIGVGIASKTFSKSIEIWGKNNSPVRVYYHIEGRRTSDIMHAWKRICRAGRLDKLLDISRFEIFQSGGRRKLF